MATDTYLPLDEKPWRATHVYRRRGDTIQGSNGAVWLYKAVPLGPMADAVSTDKIEQVAAVLEGALEELATLSGATGGRRYTARSGYREVHLLLVNVPQWWLPPATHPNAAYLHQMYPDTVTQRRVLMLGVRLQSKVTGFRANIDSIVQTLIETGVPPLSNFEEDSATISTAMARHGLRSATDEEMRLANSWWAQGQDPAVTLLPHADHLHVMRSAESAATLSTLQDSAPGCGDWPEVPDTATFGFSSVAEIGLDFVESTSAAARWATDLIDQGVSAISIRGLLEPGKVTRGELRRHRQNYIDDVNARASSRKLSRAEQDDMLNRLSEVEAFYATGGPASVIDASVTIALSGRDARTGFDPREIGERAGLALVPMQERQAAALEDMMIGSPVRANPHLHDMTSTMLAHSGLSSLSTVGDDRRGALIGFGERDAQPAWMDQMAATDESSPPIMAVVGQTGSGKTLLMQWLADQYARIPNSRGERTPVIMIDPKKGSDLSGIVRRSGGTVHSLDDLTQADGAFDAMRFSISKSEGVEMAHSLLMQINPWGTRAIDFEAPLMNALAYGSQQGATCTGQALLIAKRDGLSAQVVELVTAVEQLAASSPMFRSLCGFDPQAGGLRVSEGITYIRVGTANLNLPAPGSKGDSITERVSLALVRAMVYGSMSALAMRQGVVMLDEGWIFLQSGRTEMERMGRLARSMQVLPVIFTQRITDALDAHMEGFISRGIILPIEERAEAEAALKLFRLEGMADRHLSRIIAKGTVGGDVVDPGHTGRRNPPNWASYRALFSPDGEPLRGTIGIYVDLAGRAVPVEIRLNPAFLASAATDRMALEARAGTTMPAAAVTRRETVSDGW